jgi:hypothetical protein
MCRTHFTWVVSLGLGWATFKWLQVLGFTFLVYVILLFNDLIWPPVKACVEGKPELLLPEDPIEHHRSLVNCRRTARWPVTIDSLEPRL